ncbi:MAG: elongation factor G [Chitinophagales bacterium]
MKVFTTDKIKNITLLGHAGSGKTSLAEAMLYEAGVTTRIGSVETGNTVSDYHKLEQERGNSIFSSLMSMSWKDSKINMIDTPGYDDFVGEVISALRVADTGVMVLNAQNGVEVGTELLWEYVEEFETPVIFVANQIDGDKADFDGTVEQAKERFGDAVTVVQYPYKQGNGFDAIIDVLKMVMYQFPEGGSKPEKLPIPAEEKEKADELHNDLVETIASFDEGLMELFFENDALTEEQMTKGFKGAMIAQEIFPVFCCSAKQNMGSGRVMGFIRDIAPSASEVNAVPQVDGDAVVCDPKGDTVLFVYRTSSEQHLGDVSYFKVYSGKLTSGSDFINSSTGGSERINQIYVMHGKDRDSTNALYAGDIGATVKLKKTNTNNTLHPKGKEYNITPIDFPEPRITVAVQTEAKADMEKIAQALNQLSGQDPTLVIENSLELKQMLLSGQGELHLAMVNWKLNNNYRLDCDYIQQRIPLRETIRKSVNSMYRHKKQSGGSGQFGEVHMRVEPYYEGMPDPENLTVRKREEVELEWGGKLVFYWCIVGGSIDGKYSNAIQKGIMEKMVDGPLTGSYVRDIRVCVYDGKMHAVDSNDMAFKLASSQAFKTAFQDANPQILEPVYRVEVMVAEDAMGDVMGDLQTRRAMIMGIEAAGHYQKVIAHVPLMELYKYSSTLRSLSQGRAKHTQQFIEYSNVPSDVQKKMIDNHRNVMVVA